MSIDADSLICPITHEYFRDPVIAEDGRLYEREAITRWINEHGTSPFTRQVLNINHLQPDDVIRQKAEQRRRLSVSYNQQSDQVQLPPIRSLQNNDFNDNIIIDVRHRQQSSILKNLLRCLQKDLKIICSTCLIIFGVVILLTTTISFSISRKNRSNSISMNDTTTNPTAIFVTLDYTSSKDFCINSFTEIRSLSVMICNTFTYRLFEYSFIAQSSMITIIFAFQQTFGEWNIDNITLFENNVKRNIFRNGGFESGFLFPNYHQCQSVGYIIRRNQFNGQYYYLDYTRGQFGYLMQRISTIIGSSYKLSFYLQNQYGPGSRFMVLLGS